MLPSHCRCYEKHPVGGARWEDHVCCQAPQSEGLLHPGSLFVTLRAGSAPRPWEFLEVAETLSEPGFWNSPWEFWP